MQQRYPRLARVIAAIEATGLTRAEIGRMAGRDGSQASRWAKGASLPVYQSAKRLADAVRPSHPDVADELLATWHYYSDPVEQGPDSTVPAEVLAVIRRNYPPEKQREAIAMLEELSGPPAGDRGRAGRDDPDIGRVG